MAFGFRVTCKEFPNNETSASLDCLLVEKKAGHFINFVLFFLKYWKYPDSS